MILYLSSNLTSKMIIKKKRKKKLPYSHSQIGVLADAFGRSYQTIKRWIDKSDDRLTSDKAKEALTEIKN